MCKAPGFFLRTIREQNPSTLSRIFFALHKTLAYGKAPPTFQAGPCCHSRSILYRQPGGALHWPMCFSVNELIPKINNHIILNTSDKQFKEMAQPVKALAM